MVQAREEAEDMAAVRVPEEAGAMEAAAPGAEGMEDTEDIDFGKGDSNEENTWLRCSSSHNNRAASLADRSAVSIKLSV